MANDFFHFKEFSIYQDRCAMKVSTDACIQGALCVSYIRSRKVKNILDIGAGTGLLSLMLKQHNASAKIDAIEIDEKAANQCKENFSRSKWSQDMNVHNTNILDFKKDKGYDIIISNPPFFSNSLKNNDENKSKARHQDTLPATILLDCFVEKLKLSGIACVMYPFSHFHFLQEEMYNRGLNSCSQFYIKNDINKVPHVFVSFFQKKEETNIITEELVIYKNSRIYTEQFKNLMQSFYLYL